ncbi:MAG: DUF4097 family beta strand repeat protein [Candidatus Aminicenantes bacterium]|nr:DUF4097 family beta strand repeat protein [Candidatus Aminicenantes bacterium]
MIKKISSILVILSVVLFVGLSPQHSSADQKYERKFEDTVALSKTGTVMLRNISGDIEVKTWNKAQVSIKAVKSTKASSEKIAQERFDLVKIDVSKQGNTLTIKTEYPKKESLSRKIKNFSVDFWLVIPSQAEADVHSVSGDVVAEKIGGELSAVTVSGDVEIMDASQFARGKSVSGDVTVTNASDGVDCDSVSGDLEVKNVNGDAELKTVSGSIKLQDIQNGDIDAETVSGKVELMNVQGAMEVKAESLSGKVEYVGDINSSGRYYMKSHSGGIYLRIPGNSAFDLKAKTFSGSIDSDFEITISGKISKREIYGTANGGGADIEAKTFSGSIRILKR